MQFNPSIPSVNIYVNIVGSNVCANNVICICVCGLKLHSTVSFFSYSLALFVQHLDAGSECDGGIHYEM